MPDNFLKIIFKWIAGLMAIGYLSTRILFYWINNYSGVNEGFYSLGEIVSIVFPLIHWLNFSLMLGFGLRDLARSNEYKISVGTVFGFVACFIIIPSLLNILIFYIQSLYYENIDLSVESRSYFYSVIYSILSNILYSFIVITLASYWRIFRKAGKKGWKSLIPFYNIVVMCDIIKRSRGWVFLFFIPLLNLIGLATITNGMARVFGKSDSFSIGLFFLPFIFFPILAFGENEYIHGEYEVVKDDLDLEDHLVD